MRIVQDILFERQGLPALFTAVFVKFEKYNKLTIRDSEGNEVVLIVPIRCSWEDKNRTTCFRFQIPLCLAWAITVHKSQELILQNAEIDIGKTEYAAGLSFVAISWLCALTFKPFTLERCKRLKKKNV